MRKVGVVFLAVFMMTSLFLGSVGAEGNQTLLPVLNQLLPTPSAPPSITELTKPLNLTPPLQKLPALSTGTNGLAISTDRSLVLAGVDNFNQVSISLRYRAEERSTLTVSIPEGAEVRNKGGGKAGNDSLSWEIEGSGEVTYSLAFSDKGDTAASVTKTLTHSSALLVSNKVKSRATATTTVIYPSAGVEERPPYIYGFPDKTFRPDSQLTRAQGIAIVVRLVFPDGSYKKESDKPNFSDVKSSHWAAKEIAKGVAEELISGYPDDTFRPEHPMSRGEYLLMLARALSKHPSTAVQVPFPDVKGDHLRSAVGLLQQLNVVQGFPDGTLKPDLALTRKEVVKVTNRVMLRFPLDHNGKASFKDVRY